MKTVKSSHMMSVSPATVLTPFSSEAGGKDSYNLKPPPQTHISLST